MYGIWLYDVSHFLYEESTVRISEIVFLIDFSYCIDFIYWNETKIKVDLTHGGPHFYSRFVYAYKIPDLHPYQNVLNWSKSYSNEVVHRITFAAALPCCTIIMMVMISDFLQTIATNRIIVRCNSHTLRAISSWWNIQSFHYYLYCTAPLTSVTISVFFFSTFGFFFCRHRHSHCSQAVCWSPPYTCLRIFCIVFNLKQGTQVHGSNASRKLHEFQMIWRKFVCINIDTDISVWIKLWRPNATLDNEHVKRDVTEFNCVLHTRNWTQNRWTVPECRNVYFQYFQLHRTACSAPPFIKSLLAHCLRIYVLPSTKSINLVWTRWDPIDCVPNGKLKTKQNPRVMYSNQFSSVIYRKDIEKWWKSSIRWRTRTNNGIQCIGRRQIACCGEDTYNRCNRFINNGTWLRASQRLQLHRTNHIESMQAHGKWSIGATFADSRHIARPTSDRMR